MTRYDSRLIGPDHIHTGYDAHGTWHTAGHPDLLCGSRAAGRLLLTAIVAAVIIALGFVVYFAPQIDAWRP